MELNVRPPKTTNEWSAYYDLRFRILREPWGQPRGSEKNEGDVSAHHFGLFDQQKLLGVARLEPINRQQMQARFVAIESEVQGQGFGHILMEAVEEFAFRRGCDVFLHARENALSFYKKRGYQVLEESYLLFGEIQHYAMLKTKPN